MRSSSHTPCWTKEGRCRRSRFAWRRGSRTWTGAARDQGSERRILRSPAKKIHSKMVEDTGVGANRRACEQARPKRWWWRWRSRLRSGRGRVRDEENQKLIKLLTVHHQSMAFGSSIVSKRAFVQVGLDICKGEGGAVEWAIAFHARAHARTRARTHIRSDPNLKHATLQCTMRTGARFHGREAAGDQDRVQAAFVLFFLFRLSGPNAASRRQPSIDLTPLSRHRCG